MSTLSFKSGKEHLKAREVEILACVLLTSLEQVKPNMEMCAEQMGFGSTGGFANSYRAILKKLKDKNWYIREEAIPAGDVDGAGDTGGEKETPKKRARGRKRKTVATQDNAEDDDEQKAPAVKKARASS
ncbi:hypothetical protein EJ08DRAFT_737029 [Tothia fuscella]|uniref:Uncharacterized protein n=1 Tax=Tothia fuscella TaxID=1048955 RepID=A0A9P4NJX7_9PEZI|nr:hypothetical protein EJ08DRAFT_737029 [Tothia fuscella]